MYLGKRDINIISKKYIRIGFDQDDSFYGNGISVSFFAGVSRRLLYYA